MTTGTLLMEPIPAARKSPLRPMSHPTEPSMFHFESWAWAGVAIIRPRANRQQATYVDFTSGTSRSDRRIVVAGRALAPRFEAGHVYRGYALFENLYRMIES